MKNSIYSLALTMLVTGAVFTSCDTAAQKEQAAKDEVQEAKQDLKEVQQEANAEAQKIASAEDWTAFKSEALGKIQVNNTRIADLRNKIKQPGKVLDPIYADRIEALQKQNRDLETRIANYETNQSDWEKFKREYNHDMDQLGQALKDLSVDNKK